MDNYLLLRSRIKNKLWPFLSFQLSAFALFLIVVAQSASAQIATLSPGWILDTERSSLSFQSTKSSAKGTKLEASTFAGFEGQIDANGNALISYQLDSIDTRIDLRNVRMRFLFFETFIFPYAQISVQIDPVLLDRLSIARQLDAELLASISIHGVSVDQFIPVHIEMLDNDTVTIESISAVPLAIADFGLMGGLQKLEEAASVSIAPESHVVFSYTFTRVASAEEFSQLTEGFIPLSTAESPAPFVAPVEVAAGAALETQGAFSAEECRGRFEILSRTDNITFETNSADLVTSSYPLLESIVDIVNRCPELIVVVAGHTDSVGPAEYNQDLSERRAASVVAYLTQNGVAASSIESVGHGEARPAFPNTTNENRQRNRRIEFSSPGG